MLELLGDTLEIGCCLNAPDDHHWRLATERPHEVQAVLFVEFVQGRSHEDLLPKEHSVITVLFLQILEIVIRRHLLLLIGETHALVAVMSSVAVSVTAIGTMLVLAHYYYY